MISPLMVLSFSSQYYTFSTGITYIALTTTSLASASLYLLFFKVFASLSTSWAHTENTLWFFLVTYAALYHRARCPSTTRSVLEDTATSYGSFLLLM